MLKSYADLINKLFASISALFFKQAERLHGSDMLNRRYYYCCYNTMPAYFLRGSGVKIQVNK